MSTVVRVDRLSKDFLTGFWRPRPTRAVHEVSFEIPGGVVFGLLGPNGAGKSTTLKILLNLLRPTSGTVELLGRPAGDLAARRHLGFLPENPTFYDHLTAEELLTYLAGLFGFHGDDRRRRVAAALDRVGLRDDRRKPLRHFSKGMVQRVGLAQAIVNDPELIILDEPMSGLDPLGRREVRDLILEWRDRGKTVLFSSHILSDAELLCSRVGILARGRLVASGALADLTGGGTRGAEVVASGVAPALVERLRGQVRRMTRIDEGRYAFEIDATERPETLVSELTAGGASLVSVSPLRTTLEDVFVRALGVPAA